MMSRSELIVKECEILSGIIGRLSSHGHATKQLAVTAWMAAMGLGWQQRLPTLHLLATMVSLLFWWLDAFFLATERRFCKRYQVITEALAANPADPAIADPMSLKVTGNVGQSCAVIQTLFAPSVVVFYAVLMTIGIWVWRTGS